MMRDLKTFDKTSGANESLQSKALKTIATFEGGVDYSALFMCYPIISKMKGETLNLDYFYSQYEAIGRELTSNAAPGCSSASASASSDSPDHNPEHNNDDHPNLDLPDLGPYENRVTGNIPQENPDDT